MADGEEHAKEIALPNDAEPDWKLYDDIVREVRAVAQTGLTVEAKIFWAGQVRTGGSFGHVQSAFQREVSACRAAGKPLPVVARVRLRMTGRNIRVDALLYTRDRSSWSAGPSLAVESDDPETSERVCVVVAGVAKKAARRPRRRLVRLTVIASLSVAAFRVIGAEWLANDIAGFAPSPTHVIHKLVDELTDGREEPLYVNYREPAEDGRFRYTVLDADCANVARPGSRRRCVMRFSIRNLGSQPALPQGPFEVRNESARYSAVPSGEAFEHNILPQHESAGALAVDLPDGVLFVVNVTSGVGTRLIVFDGERPEATRQRTTAPSGPALDVSPGSMYAISVQWATGSRPALPHHG